MRFSLSSWRPAQLLVAWCAYWLALLLVAIGPGLPALWRVTRPAARGSASVSFGDGVLKLVVSEGATTLWTRDLGIGALVLCVGVPPLVLWALWLRAQRGRRASVAAGHAG